MKVSHGRTGMRRGRGTRAPFSFLFSHILNPSPSLPLLIYILYLHFCIYYLVVVVVAVVVFFAVFAANLASFLLIIPSGCIMYFLRSASMSSFFSSDLFTK